MINLIKKLIFLGFLTLLALPVWAFSSSSFLISQSAFKNFDYSKSLDSFNSNEFKFSNENLLDKIIAAIITEDLTLANKIASKIILDDPQNQEAYTVKLIYLHKNNKTKQIKDIQNRTKDKNELIDFIFLMMMK